MKPTLIALVLAAASPAFAETCATVEVDNVRPQQGHLMVSAFGTAETYGRTPMVSLRLPAGEASMRFALCGLRGSVIALRLFQDLDSDGKMGANLLGLPTEPWGGSGTPGATGPTWDTGKVALDGSAIKVRMSQ